MKLIEVINTVTGFFRDFMQKPGSVISIQKSEQLWKVLIEVIEESEYMRKIAKNDIMALYEVFVDDDLNILSFERKCMRERVDIDSCTPTL